tara:strand:- start:39301 stop:39876 length:576 start_codon:yes stop_codon:yes gene_type:complete
MGLRKRLSQTAGFVLLALTLAACAGGPARPTAPDRVSLSTLPEGASATAMGDDAFSRATLDAINADRVAEGIPPLNPDTQLQHAAAVHSADMAGRKFIGHYNPDRQGPNERMLAVWPEFKGSLAENIAAMRGPLAKKEGTRPEDLANALVKQWRASPQHRKNMRNTDFTIGGVGIARDGDTVYVTTLFATP